MTHLSVLPNTCAIASQCSDSLMLIESPLVIMRLVICSAIGGPAASFSAQPATNASSSPVAVTLAGLGSFSPFFGGMGGGSNQMYR